MKAFVKTKQNTFVEVEIISTICNGSHEISINRIKSITPIVDFYNGYFYLNEESVIKNKSSHFSCFSYFNDGYYLDVLNKRCNVEIDTWIGHFRVKVYYWDGNCVLPDLLDLYNISHIEHYLGQDSGFYLIKNNAYGKSVNKNSIICDSFVNAFNSRERSFVVCGKKYYLSAEECKDDNKPVIIKMNTTNTKKYKVHLGYYTSIDVEVTADNESQAKENAYAEVARPEYDNELLGGLEAECCEVYEIK